MQVELVYPVFIQVALTFLLAYATGGARYFAIKSGQVKMRDIVLGQRAWPKKLQQLGNTLNNQWETPILFYAGVAFALILGAQSPALLPLAWAWVGFRILHAAIYVTSNMLLFRFLAFVTGATILLAFWIILAVEILSR